MKIITYIILLVTFILVVSCGQHNKSFDTKGWLKTGDLGSYPDRAAMVDDLLKNKKLSGLTYCLVLK